MTYEDDLLISSHMPFLLCFVSLHHIYFEFLMTEDAYGWFLWHKR